MKKQIKTLYQKAKTGKIHYWKAWTDGGEVIVEHGTMDGKPVVNRYNAQPTNVGRANERNAEQQAQFEVDSLYKKRLDKKYCETIEEAKEEKFLPMLAHSTEVVSKRNKIEYPCTVQRKFNGLRCITNWRDGEIFLMSRGNKQYHVSHIEEQLSKLLSKNTALDGELYIHGTPLSKLNSLIKQEKTGSEELEYHVYDMPRIRGKNLGQKTRTVELEHMKKLCKGTNIKIVQNHIANTWEEIVAFEKQFVKEGYEGAIIRFGNEQYEFANRSNHLLKVKSFKDGEFKVVNYDVEESNINGKKISAVVWICQNDIKSPDGTIKTFEVRPKGTFTMRATQLQNVKSYIGKKLTVKYFERTPDQIPFHGVGVCFRLEEDLPNG